jgi:sulfate permease, SulP family
VAEHRLPADAPGQSDGRLARLVGVSFKIRIATALRETFAGAYRGRDFRGDLMAGVVVGIVALPLSMALAIASGVPPQHGLYTAIVAGALTAILGGSAVNVSGPTAAFVVLLAPIAATYGLAGLALASVMAGIILILMGAFGLGRLIHFIPHPVTTGFTAGIAVVIALLQLKDFFGLTVPQAGEHTIERVVALARAAPSFRWQEILVGAATLATLFLWPRLTRRVPGALAAVLVGALLAQLCHLDVATIATRFSYDAGGGVLGRGIPSLPPLPILPWNLPGPHGTSLHLSFELIEELLGPALAIAMLGAIESLLCAVVADGMAGTRHDPDAELVGQGFGNIAAPFFGGFAATGAIARTATNLRAGARSPIAAIVHAAFLLLAVVLIGPLLGYLPMASLAGLLLYVAWNMSDARHLVHIMKVAPKSDVFVLLSCFGLTVIFDMVIAVGSGVVLAAMLFMRRMAEISTTRLVEPSETTRLHWLPPDVLFYEIAGPLFFGAAEKAVSMLNRVPVAARAAILHVGAVPTMDVTGLVALETAITRLNRNGIFVIIAGVQPQPAKLLERSGIRDQAGKLALCPSLDDAIHLIARTDRGS